MSQGDLRVPPLPVSGYAYVQLVVAPGCLAALRDLVVRESEDSISIIASPFGAYSLVRNAIDSAATAL